MKTMSDIFPTRSAPKITNQFFGAFIHFQQLSRLFLPIQYLLRHRLLSVAIAPRHLIHPLQIEMETTPHCTINQMNGIRSKVEHFPIRTVTIQLSNKTPQTTQIPVLEHR